MKQLFFNNVFWNYFVDESGNIYSKNKKIMKPYLTDKGYLKISLVYNGVKRTFAIHRLVLITHNPSDNHAVLEVNHIDGNKLNNHVDNLEWCTRDHNMQHAVKAKLIGQCETHSRVKLTREQVIEIVSIYGSSKLSQNDLAKKYGVHKSTINAILAGRSWKPLLKEIGYL